jgi:4-diphosphocytidyl-2-C-methyl-D-erythritol kinase
VNGVAGGRLSLALPAPAKLNLFLRVIGRRPDGYHELRTCFVAIDLVDLLDFESLDSPAIERHGDLTGPGDVDLAVRAARLLQQRSGCAQGVRIDVRKRIPTGAGLGGGSSDAATTLIALNRLWNLGWPRDKLAPLARELGADVAFFLQPGPALGEGVGERLSPLAVPPRWYALIHPQVHVFTAEIFNAPELTAHLEKAKIQGFSADSWQGASGADGLVNDLEPIVRRRVPEVDAAIRHLSAFGSARMTGSGATVFAAFETEEQARRAIAGASSRWATWAVEGLAEHPLACW